jgi:hypothetical protein
MAAGRNSAPPPLGRRWHAKKLLALQHTIPLDHKDGVWCACEKEDACEEEEGACEEEVACEEEDVCEEEDACEEEDGVGCACSYP